MENRIGRCGYIALIGRPNVGKSTLLNQLLDRKLSITSRKPQTTRHRILGIKTIDTSQMIFVDTPGLHRLEKHALNRYMNKTVHQVIWDVDVIVFVVTAGKWLPNDELVLEALQKVTVPVLLAINKIDKLGDMANVLPFIEKINALRKFEAIIPVSAKLGNGVKLLEEKICEYLPESVHFFPDDQSSDRSVRFFAAEFIREKLMRLLGEEVPYGITVEIESFEESETLIRIHALILVDRPGQKKIVIGEKGNQLKDIATRARKEMEKFFDKKIFLRCWVKVRQGWADDERALKSLGYD